MHEKWRMGQGGRTIYRQTGELGSKDDKLLGIMNSKRLATIVVLAANRYFDSLEDVEDLDTLED